MAGTRAPGRHYRGSSDAPRPAGWGGAAAGGRAGGSPGGLGAARELLGGDGSAATSIERLCATASVSTRNFYEEFPGREALLVALHDRITGRALANAVAALTGHEEKPLADRVDRVVRAYITT